MAEFVQLYDVYRKYVEKPQADYRRNDKLAVTKEERKELYRQSKTIFSEGLAELNKLTLSPIEKNGVSNFRKFLKEAIRACDAGMKGKEAKALRIMLGAESYANKYNAVLRGLGRVTNGSRS